MKLDKSIEKYFMWINTLPKDQFKKIPPFEKAIQKLVNMVKKYVFLFVDTMTGIILLQLYIILQKVVLQKYIFVFMY